MSAGTWEHIAADLSEKGWSWGCVQAVMGGVAYWYADAHRDGAPRLVARAPDKLDAFEKLRALCVRNRRPT